MWRILRTVWRRSSGVDYDERSFEKDMADELAFHLEERAADLVRRGLTASEARRQARIEFGNPAAVSEQCRDARGTRALDELSQDLRFAWRTIRRRKLVSAIVVLTLTFGVGISSGVFTMLSAATLRPQLPDADGTFVRVHTSLTTEPAHPRPFAPTTLAQYEGLRERLTTIRPLAAWQNFGASVGGNGGSERVLLVSCNFFDVYAVARAARGRLLDAHDCERRERAVVIAYDTWRRRFDADESIVGRSITIAGVGVTVVGVAAGDFAPEGGSAWLPFTVRDAFYVPKRSTGGVEDRWLSLAGRLVPGSTLARAQAEADVVASSIDVDRRGQRRKILVTDGALIHDPNVRGNVIGMLTLVMGALSALVLIVCGNVAILLLSQAAARQREIAIRLAMGAARGRLIRMLLTETLALAACAGVASYFVARAVPAILLQWLTERPPWFPTAPDWRVFAYLCASVVLAGVAAGLAPAAESLRADLLTSLKGQRSVAGATSRPRMHAVLVAGQVALGFILLSGAMLFLGTHYRTVTREVGYESRHVLMPRVSYSRVPGAPSGPPPADLRAVLSAVPGTVSVAFAATAPGFGGAEIEIAPAGGLPIAAESNEVSPGFFSAIALPIVRGRALGEQDRECEPAHCPAVISEALAARLFPAGDALGGALQTRDRRHLRIVGVAADTSVQAGERADPPIVYVPWHDDGRAYQALVRFNGDATSFADRVGAALRQRYTGSVVDTHTLRWPLDNWLTEISGIEELIVALGVAAAALAALGVFGVVSFAVSRREQEFGIRIALGATRAQIYTAVIQAGSRPVVTGLALGTLVALLTAVVFARVLAALQFTVSPLDPRIYVAAALPLAIVIALALIIPARRAISVDPLRALKYE